MKPALLICVLLSLCGCATPPEIRIPEVSRLPEGWGRFESSRFAGGDCPVLYGTYLNSPDEFGPNGKRTDADEYAAFMIYKLFPFYLSEVQVVSASEVTASKGTISVRQDSASFLTLQDYVETNEAFESTSFSMSEGDFSCADGILKFRRQEQYGMMEGQSVNFQVQVQANKADDGSLIMIWSRGPYRGNAPEKAEFVHVFYRFPPAPEK
ncbi:MAG: hypothetical protein EXR85_04755 [Xanthomonadales bacterium]|nr:hypothetical protein [Xanthomonadales bacterium]